MPVTNKVVIANNDGSVGIGTTSPAYKLDVSGTLRVTSTALFTGGNVGIGTTSPSTKLHIYDSSATNMISVQNSSGGGASTIGNDSSGNLYIKPPSNIYFQALSGTNSTIIGTAGQIILNSSSNTTFTGAGSVGIGTTSPDYKLTVSGSSALFKIHSTSATFNSPSINLLQGAIDTVISATNNGLELGTYSAHPILFKVNNTTEAMRITSGGNVGIGTTVPTGSFHVAGSTTTLGSMQIVATVGGGPSAAVTFKPVNAGSVNTNYIFELNPNGGAYGYFAVNNVDPGINQSLIQLAAYGLSGDSYINVPQTSQNFSLRVNTSTKFYLQGSSGNVGIGTTSPSRLLHVAGNIHADGNCFIKGNNNELYFASSSIANASIGTDNSHNIGRADTTGYHVLDSVAGDFVMGAVNGGLTFGTSNSLTYATARMRINNVGNVGIGITAPDHKLHVNGGTTRISDNVSTGTFLDITPSATQADGIVLTTSFYGAGAYGPLRFNLGGSEKMRITSGGNVGIGTTSPGAKLESYAGSSTAAVLWGQIIRNEGNGNTTGYGAGLKLKNSSDGTPNEIYKWAGIAAIAGTAYSNRTDLGLYTAASSTADATEKVRITGDGDVGINTTSPSTKLNIKENNTGTEGFIITNWNNVITSKLGSDSSTGGGKFSLITNGSVTNVFVSSYGSSYFNGGSVGIGTTSPAYALDVTGTIRATADIIAYSDARVKDNVETITDALDKVTSLRGVSYTRKDSEDKSRKVGVIAQEVLDILPEVVQQDDSGNYSVAYSNIVGVLIEAIKELKAEINELKNNK